MIGKNLAANRGIAIPQVFPHEPVDMDLIRTYVEKADTYGYHSLWVQEQIIGSSANLEPISLLCYVAAITRHIRLGTAVAVATTRNPVHLAKQFSTLDQMSGGRVIVGIALGGCPHQYRLLGGTEERRVRHFLEGLEVMKALWERPRSDFSGHFWKLDGVAMEPKPVQRPHPPIWFGGRHPDALRRAVKYAEGWISAGSSSTEEFKSHVTIIREALEGSGRDPSTFAISKRVYLALDDDADRAERRLREWFGHHYGNANLAPRVSIWGGETRCEEGLQEVVDAGAQMLVLNPVFDHHEHLEALKPSSLSECSSPYLVS